MQIGPFEITEPVPELKAPHALAMLRPWVDVGSVGTIVLDRLEAHFGSQELGKLDKPGTFFDFTRYRPIMTVADGAREITVPNTSISYAQVEGGPDLLFLHLLEPHMFGEDYVDATLDLLKTFGVTRYHLLGSMYDAVPHTRQLLVTGTIGGSKGDMPRLQRSTYQGPTTITYQISQLAPNFGIETASVIVHLPQYVQLEEDFNGASRLLETLKDVYHLPEAIIDPMKGQSQYDEIAKAVASNPRLVPLIKELEQSYDDKASGVAGGLAVDPLSPEVEEFLQGLDWEND